LRDLGIDERIILKLSLKMFKGKDWIDWLQTGTRGELL
jgi:hypothetical protein